MLLFAVLLGIYQYDINQIYGMVTYPDEFGYWATAANMLGWDWSQMASRGSYYSFGYSLILFPILKFCEDSVIAYKTAVTVNFSLHVVSFFLLKGIYKRIFIEQVEGEDVLAIGCTLLYPAWIVYSQMTLVDSLLIFMVILSCYLWLRFVEQPSIRWGIALVLSVMYSYSLHMRSVGIVVALGIVMVLWCLKNPSYGKKILFLLLLMILIFWLIGCLKDIVQHNVFSKATKDMLNVNDYNGQLEKVGFLFSVEGIKQAFSLVLGKILYMGLASAGTVFWAVLWSIEQLKILIKNEITESKLRPQSEDIKKQYQKMWLGFFFVLIFLGQLAICIIATIKNTNTEWMIYGRYIESIIPIGCFLGVSYVLQRHSIKKVFWGISVLYSIAAFSCIWKMKEIVTDSIRGEHSVATIFLLENESGSIVPINFFVRIWIVGILLMALLQLLFKVFRKEKIKIIIYTVIFAGMTIWGIDASKIYVYRANDYMSKEMIGVNVLEEGLQKGKEIYYLEEGNERYVSYIQMQLRENVLAVASIDEVKKMNPLTTLIVVDGKSKYIEYMEAHYKRKTIGFNYYVFYNK